MTSGSEWQGSVGRNWAAMCAYTDRALAGLTSRLLDRIATVPGEAIADIGCGAGQLSLALAEARPGARIRGVDISPELVETARARAQGRAGVTFDLADAAQWQPVGWSPDLVVSRHGVMFFDDPARAFAHLAGLARRGARLVFSCFRTPAENPWASGVAALIPKRQDMPAPDPRAPGPFAFSDADHVRGILRNAGWSPADFEPVDFAFVAGEGEDPVADALYFFSRIGPASSAMAQLQGAERTAVEERLADLAVAHRDGDRIAFPAAAWIVSAQKV